MGDQGPADFFAMIEEELSSALALYWDTASRVLQGSSIRILDPPEDHSSLEKNFFSALFLYSYHRAGVPKSRRVFYATVNQCLRGMVTGCDNLLDDEYKKTLETDLPEGGVRFRSVLDIMVSDHVLFELLSRQSLAGEFEMRRALRAAHASLVAMARSGAQEASEEGGVSSVLSPDEVLSRVHHFKTGLLFQSPWAVPSVLENRRPAVVDTLMDALYRIGMGCQVMDDMVDLSRDLRLERHNYVSSLLYHQDDGPWERLRSRVSENGNIQPHDLMLEFPQPFRDARKTARGLLEQGLGDLFAADHQKLVNPVIGFLSERIGAERMMIFD